jgi:hypothetical protein
MFTYGSSVYQKCSNYVLTNLLFGLCRLVWIINMLVTCPSPYLETLTRPLLLKCCELENVPQFFILPLLSLWIRS